MAILKIKKLIEDLENNTTTVLSSVTKIASTAANAGTSAVATTAVKSGSAAYAGTSMLASSAAALHGGAGTHTY